MGWDFGYKTREDLVDYLSGRDCVLRSVPLNNVLWTIERRHKRLHIMCNYLDHRALDDEGHSYMWGYKSISEMEGPRAHGCPLAFLEMVPPDGSTCAQKWREQVRNYHAHLENTPLAQRLKDTLEFARDSIPPTTESDVAKAWKKANKEHDECCTCDECWDFYFNQINFFVLLEIDEMLYELTKNPLTLLETPKLSD